MDKNKADQIFKLLEREYADVKTALNYKDALQLLVATILSAQCTDARVNIVTDKLFLKYKTAADYAAADITLFEEEIHSTGFYKNKARNIIAAANMIIDDFFGEVPGDIQDLIKLPGVARKTANVVLYNIFGKNEGIAVDTHVKRLSGRLGFSVKTDPEKIENDLMSLFSRDKWGKLSNLLIAHGRSTCKALKPACRGCVLKSLCQAYKDFYPEITNLAGS
ncbi:MAG: endonuclease III [Candidatus Omnitrophota bacterium]